MMDRDEVKVILKVVVDFYGKRVMGEDSTAWVNNWHMVLKDENFDDVNNNLIKYIKTNEYPPKPANLISPKDYGVKVPGVDATKEYLAGLRNNKINLSDKELEEKLKRLRMAVNRQQVAYD
mgnify:CR=1 FL=1